MLFEEAYAAAGGQPAAETEVQQVAAEGDQGKFGSEYPNQPV